MAKKQIDNFLDGIVENIHNETMEEILSSRYATYAKYVIQDRAIPDARDGLKPVQRRIIYSMYKSGNVYNRPHRKSAHTVGEVMGGYHPHGDSSIYEALVRMSQSWKVNNSLIDFQGNNGSIDGDGPAAYRYTEARLSQIAEEMVRDIDKDTVDMVLTFDDSQYEPKVLPSRFPNLLTNGTQGIAVGMATDIPPHNLREVIAATIYRINHPNCTSEQLMEFIPGPDFPTGGIIYKNQGLIDTYLKGNGRLEVCSKFEVVDTPKEKKIVITEIPYGVVKIELNYEIDKLRHDKILTGISEVRDESDRSGIRVVVEIKKEAKVEPILKYLLNKTKLKTSYSPNMVAIINGTPKTMTLKDFIDSYVAHQVDVVTRRSVYLKKKNLARLEIVNGLIKAVSILDEVVETIRASKDKQDAKINIQNKFGFSEAQSEAIVMLQLYKLSNTDMTTLINEKKSLEENLEYLEGLLTDENKLNKVIITDLKEIAKKYGKDRKTEIREKEHFDLNVDKRDLITKEEVYVSVTRDGYLKRSTKRSYESNDDHTPGIKEGDVLVFMGKTQTTDYIICFTNAGNVLPLPIHELSETKWKDEGKHINSLMPIAVNEKIIAAYTVEQFRNDINIVLVSKFGQIKRTPLSLFFVPRRNRPLTCMKLMSDDEVVAVNYVTGNSNVVLFTNEGESSMFNENEIPLSGLKSGGVKAMSKLKGQHIAGMVSIENDGIKCKVILITDRACHRIYDTSNTLKTKRLGKHSVVFRCFKNDPHKLIYVAPLVKKDEEHIIKLMLSTKETRDLKLEDYFVTPIEKYAKSTISIPRSAKVESIFAEGGENIDTKIATYQVATATEIESLEQEQESISLDIAVDSESQENVDSPVFETNVPNSEEPVDESENSVEPVDDSTQEEASNEEINEVVDKKEKAREEMIENAEAKMKEEEEKGYTQVSIFDDDFDFGDNE